MGMPFLFNHHSSPSPPQKKSVLYPVQHAGLGTGDKETNQSQRQATPFGYCFPFIRNTHLTFPPLAKSHLSYKIIIEHLFTFSRIFF